MTQKDKISPTHSTLCSNTSPSVAHSFSQDNHPENKFGRSPRTHEDANCTSHNSVTPLLSTTIAGTFSSAATDHAIQTEMTPPKASKSTSTPKRLWRRVKRVLSGKNKSTKDHPVQTTINDHVQAQNCADGRASTPCTLPTKERTSPESLATSMSTTSGPHDDSDTSSATTGCITDATSVCACEDAAQPQPAAEEKPATEEEPAAEDKPATSGQCLQVPTPTPKPRQYRSRIPVPVPKPVTNGTEYGSRVLSVARSSRGERAGPGNPLAASRRAGERKRTMAIPAAATRE
ncbi:hypothetical protein NpPPO83_00005770 [Neofusicoccum parvum]|uniref:Uncharacterized protein n=1 Tax=Neofusicoccum parvum TaxID=310453 RepID=A0ACB5RT08_9PEZI|nr:hypothetical protein NpPPO83_00005770 [Neofusicoccum parvum]